MPYRIFIVEDQKIFLDGLTAIFGYIPEVDVCGSASSGGEVSSGPVIDPEAGRRAVLTAAC